MAVPSPGPFPTSAPQHRAAATLARRPRVVAVTGIWVATVLVTLLSPDLVTGSAHEHLPLAGMSAWVWAAVSSGYVVLATGDGRDPSRPETLSGWLVAAVWLVVLAVCALAPALVTGTDPTTIPIAAVVAPVAGMAVTGWVCLLALRRRG